MVAQEVARPLAADALTFGLCGGTSLHVHFLLLKTGLNNFILRENGIGELYAYLPHHPFNTRACLSPTTPPDVRAKSIAHDDWGFSVGRGAWRFETGRWITVAERVRIGTGQEDGKR